MLPPLARRRVVLGATLAAATVLARPARSRAAEPALPGPAIEVWKNRGCACCDAWAEHLAAAGLTVEAIHEVDEAAAVGASFGVPADLAGCHSARFGAYLVEGHVPAAALRQLLAEAPPILGLAVPGMPMGSPGMAVAGMPAEAFQVIAFTADGHRHVFMDV